MKIGVCMKQVPDTATKIRVKEDKSGIVEEGIKYIISPYDEFAIEEALRTKDKFPGSEVCVLSVGPKRVQEALRNALAMGCDQAIHVSTDGQPEPDASAVAKVLAAEVKTEKIEILFTGKNAADDDNAQVSQMTAEYLDWPHVTVVSKFEIESDGKKAKAYRDIEGGAVEVWETEIPVVIAATKGLNEPRYASLKGIMAAKKKPLKEVTLQGVGVPANELASKVTWKNYEAPQERKNGKIFKDDPKSAVAQVVRLLREEAKVI